LREPLWRVEGRFRVPPDADFRDREAVRFCDPPVDPFRDRPAARFCPRPAVRVEAVFFRDRVVDAVRVRLLDAALRPPPRAPAPFRLTSLLKLLA
jgi:hypothetical protein